MNNNDDDYGEEDKTEFAPAIPHVDDDATNPLQRAAPADVRRRFEETLEPDEPTMERSALDLADLGFDLDADVDATFERPAPQRPEPVEDVTVLRPAPTKPAPRPAPRSSSPKPSLPQAPVAPSKPSTHSDSGRRPPSKLQPRPDRMKSDRSSSGRSGEAPITEPSAPPAFAATPAKAPVPVAAPMLSSAASTRPPADDDQLRRLGLTRRKRANANNVRANSGFYSLPDANPSMLDVTVQGVVLPERNRAAIGLAVAFVGGTVTAVGLMSLALGRWSSPTEIMTWTLLGMVLCSGVVAGVVLPHDDLRVEGLREAFMPMGVAVALTLISGLAWQIAPVRHELRQFASASPEMAQKVLADPSYTVALAECLRISDRYEYAVWRKVLVSRLVGRDALAKDCLAGMEQDAAKKLSATLADRWHAELLDPDVGLEHACDTASSLSSLDRPPGEVETRLLSCVLTAPSSGVQQCCGVALARQATLSGSDWVSKLKDVEGYTPDGKTAAGLMTLAFHQQGVNASQREFIKAADFSGPAAREMALSFSCDALRQDAQGLAQHFSASLGESCPVDTANLPRGRELWLEVCSVVEVQLGQGGVEPVKALCAATKDAAVTVAVSDASRIIANAAEDRTGAKDYAYAIDVEANTLKLRGPQIRTVRSLRKRWAEKEKKEGKKPEIAPPTFKPDW